MKVKYIANEEEVWLRKKCTKLDLSIGRDYNITVVGSSWTGVHFFLFNDVGEWRWYDPDLFVPLPGLEVV